MHKRSQLRSLPSWDWWGEANKERKHKGHGHPLISTDNFQFRVFVEIAAVRSDDGLRGGHVCCERIIVWKLPGTLAPRGSFCFGVLESALVSFGCNTLAVSSSYDNRADQSCGWFSWALQPKVQFFLESFLGEAGSRFNLGVEKKAIGDFQPGGTSSSCWLFPL